MADVLTVIGLFFCLCYVLYGLGKLAVYDWSQWEEDYKNDRGLY